MDKFQVSEYGSNMSVDDQVAEIDAKIRVLEDRRREIQRRRMISCTHCGKRARISKLTLYQNMYYVEPYGCTGGDFYLPSDAR